MTMENSGHQKTSPVADNGQAPAHANVPNPSRRRFNRAGVGASAVLLTLASRSVLADTMCKSPSGFDSLEPSMGAGTKQTACAGKPPSWWLQQHPWPVDKDAPFSSFFGDGYSGLYAGASASSTNAGTAAAASTGGEKWFDAFSNNRSSSASGSGNNGKGGSSAANGNSENNGNNSVARSSSTTANGMPTLSTDTELLLKNATMYQAMAGARTPVVVKNLLAAWLNARHRYNDFPTEQEVVRIFQEWQKDGSYEVRAAVKWNEADINRYLASANSVG